MLRAAVAVAPCASVAVSVMVCVPTDRVDFENEVPVPMAPSMLLVHTSDAPVSAPSSGSVPLPVNDTDVPCVKLAPFAGVLMDADGAWFAGAVIVTVIFAVPMAPLESV